MGPQMTTTCPHCATSSIGTDAASICTHCGATTVAGASVALQAVLLTVFLAAGAVAAARFASKRAGITLPVRRPASL